MDFKQRVCNSIIVGAQIYKTVLLDYEYLLYSPKFINNPFYILSANKDNYEHLTGVHSLVSAQSFYEMCLNGTINVSNFDFRKGSKSESSIKGTVREKIIVLPLLASIFSGKLSAEENFSKGHVHCFLATSDGQITLGFVNSKFAVPQTLLKGKCLNSKNTVDVSIVLRRKRGNEKFDTVVQCDAKEFSHLFPNLVVSD